LDASDDFGAVSVGFLAGSFALEVAAPDAFVLADVVVFSLAAEDVPGFAED
jgi:hypothetical protein